MTIPYQILSKKEYACASDMCNAMAEDMASDSSMPVETRDIVDFDYDLARVLEKYLHRWQEQIEKWYGSQSKTP